MKTYAVCILPSPNITVHDILNKALEAFRFVNSKVKLEDLILRAVPYMDIYTYNVEVQMDESDVKWVFNK